MNALVIYYSYENSTHYVAKKIAKGFDADLCRIETVKSYKYKGFLKYLIFGSQASYRMIVDIRPLECDIDKYDLILIGTPVWAGNMTPAVRKFLVDNNFGEKKVVLFSTFLGAEGKTFKEMKKYLSSSNIIDQTGFRRVLQDPLETDKKIDELVERVNS